MNVQDVFIRGNGVTENRDEGSLSLELKVSQAGSGSGLFSEKINKYCLVGEDVLVDENGYHLVGLERPEDFFGGFVFVDDVGLER